MLKKFWYFFLVLLIEGSSLMVLELLGAKLLAPFYGSSLYVWTAILCITAIALALLPIVYFIKLVLTPGQALDPNSAASSGKFNPKVIKY
jgi:uncharacterized membrane protein YhaH (DUF805 family)